MGKKSRLKIMEVGKKIKLYGTIYTPEDNGGGPYMYFASITSICFVWR